MNRDGSLLERINDLIASDRFSLPVFNSVAVQIQRVASDPLHAASQVEDLIQLDQSLAVEVLRAANSPFYAGLATIRTIRNAVVRLGIEQVTRLAMLASERAKYKAMDARLNAMLQELWRHAKITAMAAQWLAKKLNCGHLEDETFLGGLLHDVGQLLILRAIDTLKATEGDSIEASEELVREVLAAAHTSLGYNLLKSWNIPEVYCHIARDHHLDDYDPTDTTLVIVRLANEASGKMGIGLHSDPALVLAATPEALTLKASDIQLAQLEVMLEDHLDQAG
jgi:HD-like signal output (HDOD) protein